MKAKGVKSVQSRVCNLKDLNPEITTDALRAALKESFAEAYGDFVELDPAIFENGEVQETYNLYSSWDWKFGKSPECETSYSKRFDWGELEVWLRLKNMHIEEIKIYSDMLDVEFPAKLEKLLLGRRYDMEDLDVERDAADFTPEQREKVTEVCQWLAIVLKKCLNFPWTKKNAFLFGISCI